MDRDGHQLGIRVADYANHRDLYRISLELRDQFDVFCLLHEHEDGHGHVSDK